MRHQKFKWRPPKIDYSTKLKCWFIDYIGTDRERHRTIMDAAGAKFQTKSEARLFSKTLPTHETPDLPTVVTVCGFAPVYLKSLEGKSSHREVEGHLRLHILPFLGDKPLKDLKRPDGEAFITHLQTTTDLVGGSIKRVWQSLGALLNLAVEDEVLDRNRLRGKKGKSPVPKGDHRSRTCSNEEIAAILTHSKPRERRAYSLLLNTGLRPGKILDLTSDHLIELPECALNMPEDATDSKKTPKWMPLNRTAYNAISGITGRLFDYNYEAGLYQKLRRAAKRANVKDVQVRDFRRTFSSRLQALGVDYLVRERLLGHAEGLTRNYVPESDPAFRAQMRNAVERLEASYGFGNNWQQTTEKAVIGGIS